MTIFQGQKGVDETVVERKALARVSPPRLIILTEAEKFPCFDKSLKSATHKSKSMTQAELALEVMSEGEVAEAFQRLKTDDPPLSLEQARERKASIKEERRANIDFIRSRTDSRVSAGRRPSFDEMRTAQLERLDITSPPYIEEEVVKANQEGNENGVMKVKLDEEENEKVVTKE